MDFKDQLTMPLEGQNAREKVGDAVKRVLPLLKNIGHILAGIACTSTVFSACTIIFFAEVTKNLVVGAITFTSSCVDLIAWLCIVALFKGHSLCAQHLGKSHVHF